MPSVPILSYPYAIFTRFILAGAEQLHDEIGKLGERVRQLEKALGEACEEYVGKPHPLLDPDLLKIKTSQELYGSASPFSASAREENPPKSVGGLWLSSQPTYAESSRPSASMEYVAQTPPSDGAIDILQLSAIFPFPWAIDINMRKRIRRALPPRMEAQRLCEEARNNAFWQ